MVVVRGVGVEVLVDVLRGVEVEVLVDVLRGVDVEVLVDVLRGVDVEVLVDVLLVAVVATSVMESLVGPGGSVWELSPTVMPNLPNTIDAISAVVPKKTPGFLPMLQDCGSAQRHS